MYFNIIFASLKLTAVANDYSLYLVERLDIDIDNSSIKTNISTKVHIHISKAWSKV